MEEQNFMKTCVIAVQLLSHAWLMDCSMPGFSAHHHLLELAQTHVHWVGDAIQPPHPLSFPSPPSYVNHIKQKTDSRPVLRDSKKYLTTIINIAQCWHEIGQTEQWNGVQSWEVHTCVYQTKTMIKVALQSMENGFAVWQMEMEKRLAIWEKGDWLLSLHQTQWWTQAKDLNMDCKALG